MKIILEILLAVGVIGFALVLGYLITTGLVWLAVWSAAELGLYTFGGSVWLLGLLVFAVVLILKGIFSRTENK